MVCALAAPPTRALEKGPVDDSCDKESDTGPPIPRRKVLLAPDDIARGADGTLIALAAILLRFGTDFTFSIKVTVGLLTPVTIGSAKIQIWIIARLGFYENGSFGLNEPRRINANPSVETLFGGI